MKAECTDVNRMVVAGQSTVQTRTINEHEYKRELNSHEDFGCLVKILIVMASFIYERHYVFLLFQVSLDIFIEFYHAAIESGLIRAGNMDL